MTSVATVFRPVIWLLSKSTNGVLRALHIDPKADEEDVSEDEIRMMVDLGEERGAIESNEKELIDNIFEFNNTTAEDVMIHRTDMVMLWVEDTREESPRDDPLVRPVPLPGLRGERGRYHRHPLHARVSAQRAGGSAQAYA